MKYLNMHDILLGVILLLVASTTGCAQQEGFKQRAARLGLEFVTDIPLSGGTTRFDYQSIDKSKRRLYIAHLGADMVTVYDIDSLKVIKNIAGVSSAHGIIAVSEQNKVYVSATGENQIYAIDEQTLKVVSKIPVGDYPDGIAYDPGTRRVFVSDEFGKTVAVVDAVNDRLLTKIKVGGEVGNTHYDPVNGLIYSADQTKNQLVAIDPQKMKIKDRYDLPGCEGAHGFYIDTQTNEAFITGEDNAAYVVLDLTQKKIVVSGKVGKGPDVLAFDPQLQLLYVSSESGTVSVFHMGKERITKVAEAFFANRAHSVSVDPKTHQVFFPLQNVDGQPVLRVMKPKDK